jgi:nucleotide-binding universal stress UspA family protein
MYNNILTAVKFSPASLYALEMGVQLARAHSSWLQIFHALDYRLKDLDALDPKLTDLVTMTEKRFEADIKPRLGDWTDFKFEFRPADPALEVCKIARDSNVDLIVLGCHQIREKMCLGRIDYVGMTILEKAPCPVMLVPFCD